MISVENHDPQSSFLRRLMRYFRHAYFILCLLLGLVILLVMSWHSISTLYETSNSTSPLEESYRAFWDHPDVRMYQAYFDKIEKGSNENEIRIRLNDVWHAEHYQLRLQGAQLLWKAWAVSRPGVHPFWIEIELTDRAGNIVGGSSGVALLTDKRVWVKSYNALISF